LAKPSSDFDNDTFWKSRRRFANLPGSTPDHDGGVKVVVQIARVARIPKSLALLVVARASIRAFWD
jgi:hypothetical protein